MGSLSSELLFRCGLYWKSEHKCSCYQAEFLLSSSSYTTPTCCCSFFGTWYLLGLSML